MSLNAAHHASYFVMHMFLKLGSSVKLLNMISLASLLFLFLMTDIFSAVIFGDGGGGEGAFGIY